MIDGMWRLESQAAHDRLRRKVFILQNGLDILRDRHQREVKSIPRPKAVKVVDLWIICIDITEFEVMYVNQKWNLSNFYASCSSEMAL